MRSDANDVGPADQGRNGDDRGGLALVILVLLGFLAAALLFFGSGWLQVVV